MNLNNFKIANRKRKNPFKKLCWRFKEKDEKVGRLRLPFVYKVFGDF